MTDAQIKQTLKNLIIIVDTREQENHHITDYFDRSGIRWISQKLDFADYSFICPPIPEIGFNDPASFAKRIAIERKADLTELSGNISQGRERFENELQRAKDANAKLILMVEDGGWQEILEHKYRTDLKEGSYTATLFSFVARYGIDIQFIPELLAGWYIYNTFKYYLREELKQLAVTV